MTSITALSRKLDNFGTLSDADHVTLDKAAQGGHQIGPKQDIIREGDKPNTVHLILEGFACRYKLLPDGSRQIVAYLIPGDFCDLHVFIMREMDHSIASLSPCTVVDIPRATILGLLEHPTIAQALRWATLVDEAILREWLVSMGRRPAEQRLAHLMCELLVRLRAVGLAQDGYELPVTQAELADTLGLSGVHVNRSLQSLRITGMIQLRGSSLLIPDVDALMEFSGFSPAYLHLLQQPLR